MKKIISYRSDLTKKAQKLRKDAVFSERVMWKHLRAKRLGSGRFVRQKPIDRYIVDFYCKKHKLIIEIDGISHHDRLEYDTLRQTRLEKLGNTVLRFNAMQVINETNAVLSYVYDWIQEQSIV